METTDAGRQPSKVYTAIGGAASALATPFALADVAFCVSQAYRLRSFCVSSATIFSARFSVSVSVSVSISVSFSISVSVTSTTVS